MYEVSFSDQAMAELNKLSMMEQLGMVEAISSLSAEQLLEPREPLGRFKRDGKTFYRLRALDYRCYFELKGHILHAHYILHGNTFNDFVVRNKLPINAEVLSEHDATFWSYLASVGK